MENKQNIKEMKQDFNSIIVDDGLEKISVKNRFNDEIGVFSFRPTDIGIIERFNSMVDDFEGIVKPLEDININPDGTAGENSTDEIEAFNEAKERLYKACDKIFGGNMSEAFFGKMHPFSIVNGKFYCEYALEGVGKFISKRFDRETKKINNRVERYTHGYRTSKHKGGKK